MYRNYAIIVRNGTLTANNSDITAGAFSSKTSSSDQIALEADGIALMGCSLDLTADAATIGYGVCIWCGRTDGVTIDNCTGTLNSSRGIRTFDNAPLTISESDLTITSGIHAILASAGTESVLPTFTGVSVKSGENASSAAFVSDLNDTTSDPKYWEAKYLSIKKDAGVSVSGEPASVTYGDTFQLTAIAANTGANGHWTWTSSDTDVLTVSGSGAQATVKAVGVGTAAVTAVYESDTTAGVGGSGDMTAGKATVTVTAKNQTVTVGGAAPDLSSPVEGTHYTVSGLVSGDALSGAAAMEYQSGGAAAVPDTTAAGTYDIAISGLTAPSDKYDSVVFVPGTLTVAPQVPHAVTVQDDGNGTASASSAAATEGTEITLTATPSTGYHFKEWQVVSGAVTIAENKFTMPGSAVTVKAIFEADAPISSGSGGGYDPPASHSITIPATAHGTVTASPTSASRGTAVTLTAVPEDGYVLDTLTVTGRDGRKLELTGEGGGRYGGRLPAGHRRVQ